MGKLQRIIFLILIGLNICTLNAQVKNICIDTNFVKPQSLNIGGIIVHVPDFKNSLPDGKWFYYRTKDCSQKNIEAFLQIEGEFENSKRNGTFIYYYVNPASKKNKERQVHVLARYKAGLLHGQFKILSSNGTKLYEGNFDHGLKQGFFIEYDPVKLDNTIRQIDYYVEDVLRYSSKYSEKGELAK
jgi:antitoxin component YwqK of YwqJK toxin-antitoxin module